MTKLIFSILLFSTNAFAATRNVVPRANDEGNIGLSTITWKGVYATKFYGDGSSLTGITTTESDPIFKAAEAFNITATSTSYWNTAYSWGNHATAGYALSANVIPSSATGSYPLTSAKASALVSAPTKCSAGQAPLGIDVNGNAADCWTPTGATYTADEVSLNLVSTEFKANPSSVTLQGNTFNGASQLVQLGSDGKLTALDGTNLTGVLHSFSESDPVFIASEASNITASSTTAWNLTSSSDTYWNNALRSETDPVYSGDEAFNITASSTTNWNTAYSWGNHALAGYASASAVGLATGTLRTDLTAETTTRVAADLAIGVTTGTLASRISAFDTILSDVNDPTGFLYSTSAVLSLSGSTMTITGTNFVVYANGVRYLKNTETIWVSTLTTGLNWIYYNSSGVLSKSATFPGFREALVATVYYSTPMAAGILSSEQHSAQMDWKTHEYLHETIGSRYATGLAAAFDNVYSTITAGEIYDDDLEVLIPKTTRFTVLYKSEGYPWYNFTLSTSSYFTQLAGVLQYNNDSGQLLPISVNNYGVYWLYASANVGAPIFVVTGEGNYSLAQAQAATPPVITGLSSAEAKLIYKVIMRRTNVLPIGYISSSDYRSVSSLAGTTVSLTNHNTLAGLDLTTSGHPYDVAGGFASYDTMLSADNALAVSTGILQVDLATEVSNRGIADAAIGLATGTLRTNLNSVILSTGVIQSSLNSVIVSTGSINSSLSAVIVSTGLIQSSLNAVIVSTGTLLPKSGGTVTGNLVVTGNMTAGYFYGDGWNLTNLPSVANLTFIVQDFTASTTGSEVNFQLTNIPYPNSLTVTQNGIVKTLGIDYTLTGVNSDIVTMSVAPLASTKLIARYSIADVSYSILSTTNTWSALQYFPVVRIKNIAPIEQTNYSGASVTPDSNYSVFFATVTNSTTVNAPSGTALNGQKLMLRIKDYGTARSLSFNAIYREGDIPLPTTTVMNETMYLGFMYNSYDSKWDLMAFSGGY